MTELPLADASECPEVRKHTECPKGYLQWHAWAEHKSKTHVSSKCPCCGLYTIWVPKKISAKMLEVLGYIARGQSSLKDCWSFSAIGSRHRTIYAILRRRLIELTGKLALVNSRKRQEKTPQEENNGKKGLKENSPSTQSFYYQR